MNSIGVDFKLKSMEVDNKNIKLQIVFIVNPSGILLDKKGLEQSLQVITVEHKQLLLYMISQIKTLFIM
jgi:hypothetical protein